MRITRIMLPAAALAFCLFASVGCESQSNNRITAEDVWNDMSPELKSMAMTEAQRKNKKYRIDDTNMRQIWNDLDTLMLMDRPVRMSKYPVP